jgi:hypothetical protein
MTGAASELFAEPKRPRLLGHVGKNPARNSFVLDALSGSDDRADVCRFEVRVGDGDGLEPCRERTRDVDQERACGLGRD